MGNSLGDEISCESSTPLTYSTLNVFNFEWPVSFEKNALEILHSAYMLLSCCAFQQRRSVIGNVPVYHAEGPGSRLASATTFFFFYYLFI